MKLSLLWFVILIIWGQNSEWILYALLSLFPIYKKPLFLVFYSNWLRFSIWDCSFSCIIFFFFFFREIRYIITVLGLCLDYFGIDMVIESHRRLCSHYGKRIFILLSSESVVFSQVLIIQCFEFVFFFPDFPSLIPLFVCT